MAPFSPEVWSLLALIGVGAILATLGRMSSAIEDEKSSHDTRIKADHLRRQYAAQFAAQKSHKEVIEVDVVEDAPSAAAA
jgi:hypothetical protein